MNKKNLNHNQYKKSSFDLVLIQEHRGIRKFKFWLTRGMLADRKHNKRAGLI